MSKQTVLDLEVSNKTVLVRVDFNVPIKEGKITNDNRIVQALPTIKYLLEHDAKVVLFSHLGKVDHKDPEKCEADKKKNNMEPVVARLSELVPNTAVKFVSETRGVSLENAVKDLKAGEIIVVQNTRYEKGESKNDLDLAKYWAGLGDLFVSDAFGSVHRAHSSTAGIAQFLPSAVGFLVEKELNMLGKAVNNPEHPFVAIIGGAKVSDKIAVVDNLLKIADKVIIGGGMAYTFMKAQGYEIGTSLCEDERIEMAKEYLAKAGDKIVLPIDTICAPEFSDQCESKNCGLGEIPSDWMGLDIGPKSIELFKTTLKGAKTVIWNGPMGVFEMPKYAVGTLEICKSLAELENATTVIGGGDSAAAAIQLGFGEKFSHISTGGGASLEYMEGKELPGIAAIQDKK